MLDADTSLLREWVMPRLRSGQSIAAIAAATGVSQSTLYRWKRQSMGVTTKLPAPPRSARIRTAVVPAPPTPTPAPPAPTPVSPAPAAVPAEIPVQGYVGDVTGPGITEQWGVTCADLGVSVVAPDGNLMSVFGDTFSGAIVGQGDWRSPVALIGSGDANNQIQYEYAGGADPSYAQADSSERRNGTDCTLVG